MDDIFTLGYDISLANPVGKRALARPVLQKSLLHECRLTGDDHCQPHARSKVIDSIGAYHKWIRDQIVLDPNSNGIIRFASMLQFQPSRSLVLSFIALQTLIRLCLSS